VAHPSPTDNSPSHDQHSDHNDERTIHAAPAAGTSEAERQGETSGSPLAAPAESRSTDWLAQTETLRALAYLVRDEKLSEIEVQRGGLRISIKAAEAAASPFPPAAFPGGWGELYAASAPGFAADPGGDDVANAATGAGATATNAGAAENANLAQVVSPMVGIFYRAPSPSDPNFVEVGDRVEIGQTLGLVETMKVFNEITSEVEGTVIEIMAQSGDLLETGDKLMVIRKPPVVPSH
jgi:acetyl-CoA carboxylase biotin carboxyl carrier protein